MAWQDEFRWVPDVIVIVGGPAKVRAVSAWFHSGLVFRLITDQTAAEGLLK